MPLEIGAPREVGLPQLAREFLSDLSHRLPEIDIQIPPSVLQNIEYLAHYRPNNPKEFVVKVMRTPAALVITVALVAMALLVFVIAPRASLERVERKLVDFTDNEVSKSRNTEISNIQKNAEILEFALNGHRRGKNNKDGHNFNHAINDEFKGALSSKSPIEGSHSNAALEFLVWTELFVSALLKAEPKLTHEKTKNLESLARDALQFMNASNFSGNTINLTLEESDKYNPTKDAMAVREEGSFNATHLVGLRAAVQEHVSHDQYLGFIKKFKDSLSLPPENDGKICLQTPTKADLHIIIK